MITAISSVHIVNLIGALICIYCQAIDIRRSYIYGQAVDNGIITFIARAASSSSSHGPCGVLPEKLETVAPALFVQLLEDVRAFGRP